MGIKDNMFNSKYSKLLTTVLIIVIIAVIALLAFLGYDVYKKYSIEAESESALEKFENEIDKIANTTNTISNTTNTIENVIDPTIDLNSIAENTTGNTSGGNNGGSTVTVKGYEVIGKIEIPKTNLKSVIIKQEDVSAASLKVAICNLYGNLNEVGGNAVLVGHNYRNGTFFSNNKKLSKGDKIYITDNSGKKVTYIINNKYETGTGDFSYATRKVDANKRHISLSTCTDDSKKRLIIWASEQ